MEYWKEGDDAPKKPKEKPVAVKRVLGPDADKVRAVKAEERVRKLEKELEELKHTLKTVVKNITTLSKNANMLNKKLDNKIDKRGKGSSFG